MDWIDDLTPDELDRAKADYWNTRHGRRTKIAVVQPGDVHTLVHVKLARPITPQEEAQFTQAVVNLSPVIQACNFVAGIIAAPAIAGNQWVFHLDCHMRSEPLPPPEP